MGSSDLLVVWLRVEADLSLQSFQETMLPMAHRQECQFYELFKTVGAPLPVPKTYFTKVLSRIPTKYIKASCKST